MATFTPRRLVERASTLYDDVRRKQTTPEVSGSDSGALLNLTTAINNLTVSEQEKKEIIKWIQDSSEGLISILITGRTGVGKSTLVNALIGRQVAKVGHELHAETKSVTDYTMTAEEGVEIVVWDSPGLQDGSGNEEEYLAELKEKCSDVDVVIYCIKLAATRSELEEAQNDLKAIKKLTATFGCNWWEHSVFVMTYANALEAMLKVKPKCNIDKMFNDKIEEWKNKIHSALLETGVPKETVKKVPVVPAGHARKPHLPGHEYWLSALWFVFMERAKMQSQPMITKLNISRLKMEDEVKPEDFKQEGYNQPIVACRTLVAAATTSACAVGAGIVIGAGIGFIGGPLGSLVGGAVGACAGAAVGSAVIAANILYGMWQKRKAKKEK